MLTKVILILQSIAMLMGSSTHLMWVINNGFLSTNYNAPLPTMIFWDSLTFLDPLAAILLIIRPRIGLILTAVIIFIDVLHNNLYYLDELYLQQHSFGEWVQNYWMIFGQLLFAVFVFITLRSNIRNIDEAKA